MPANRSSSTRRTAIAVIAGVMVLGFLAFLAAAVVQNDDPDADPSASPSASVDPTPTPSGPLPDDTKPTCVTGQTGRIIEAFDRRGDWRPFKGDVEFTVDPGERRQGSASFLLNNGQSATDGWIQRKLSRPLDLSRVTQFRIWLHQNGNLIPNNQDWRIRFVSRDGSIAERVFPQPTVGAALEWCQDSFTPADLRFAGDPDLAAIVAIQINIPKYPGSGAANLVNIDALSVIEGPA